MKIVAVLLALIVATPAFAQHRGWHGGGGGHMGGGWHHGGGGNGWVGPAIGLGMLGLGLGAAGAYGGYYDEPGYYQPQCPYGYYYASNGRCYPE